MTKSPFVLRLDEVQHALTALLKPLGFSRSGRTYNRSWEDGVMQVIGLQMGQFEIGKKLPVSSTLQHLQTDHYGQFTVNLGVYVREVWEYENPDSPSKIVEEYHCHIRRRLGASHSTGKEFWWYLDKPAVSLVDDITPLLKEDGIPFLERFAIREAIIRDWVSANDNELHLSARPRVDVALILAKLGRNEEAVSLLTEQVRSTKQKAHAQYVRTLSRKLGLGELPISAAE